MKSAELKNVLINRINSRIASIIISLRILINPQIIKILKLTLQSLHTYMQNNFAVISIIIQANNNTLACKIICPLHLKNPHRLQPKNLYTNLLKITNLIKQLILLISLELQVSL